MKLKVCGVTRIDQLIQLADMEVDFAGLIFYPDSKRFALPQLSGVEAQSAKIKKIGVFVNESPGKTLERIEAYGLFAVQLHGNESPEVCATLQEKTTVIKAIGIDEETDISAAIADYSPVVDYLLFDTKWGGKSGGTGKKFAWHRLQNLEINKPFFLSGGIGPQDATEITNLKHPHLFAIDINSGFETAPGVKDLSAVHLFYNELRRVDTSLPINQKK